MIPPGLYGYTEDGMIVPRAQATVKVASPTADIVLDPVCGSGTAAVAAARLNRRFIVIDRERKAVDITWGRLPWYVWKRTLRVEWLRDRGAFRADPMFWDCGVNFVVRGDSLDVLRSMPDSFVALVIADPPFNAGREFRNREGDGFSDIWRWDAAAEARLAEIEAVDLSKDRWIAGKTRAARDGAHEAMLLNIRACRAMGSDDLASYLTWMALLLMECRRVMGSYDLPESAILMTPRRDE